MIDAGPILAAHGLKGRLQQFGKDHWSLSAEKGIQGVAVQIGGEPDQAIIEEAARMIAEAFAGRPV